MEHDAGEERAAGHRGSDFSEKSGLLGNSGRDDVPASHLILQSPVERKGGSWGRYFLGLLLLVVVAAIWTGASVLVKAIYDTGYAQPFFLTYVSNSLFVILLPVFALVRWAEQALADSTRKKEATELPVVCARACLCACRSLPCSLGRDSAQEPASAGSSRSSSLGIPVPNYPISTLLASVESALCGASGRARKWEQGSCVCSQIACFGGREGRLLGSASCFGVDWWSSARAALLVSPLWFLAQETYNWSLEGVSVSVSTVLSTTSCVFTLALSVLVLRERMTWLKAAGVGLTVLGGIAVASERWGLGLDRPLPVGGRHARKHHGDDGGGGEGEADGPSNTAWGILVCLCSAVLYGVYTVAIRVGVPDEEEEEGGGVQEPVEARESRVLLQTDAAAADAAAGGRGGAAGGRGGAAGGRGGAAGGRGGAGVRHGSMERGIEMEGAMHDGATADGAIVAGEPGTGTSTPDGGAVGAAAQRPLPGAIVVPAEGEGYRGTVPLPVFFGLLGAFNAVALLPIVLVLHWTGVEPLDHRVSGALGLVVLKGLLDNVLADFLWAKAIALTTPTVATVGLSLTIPMAMASDWVMHGAPSVALVLGAALVIGGFLAINFGGTDEGEDAGEKDKEGHQRQQGATSRARDGGAGVDRAEVG